MKFRYTGDRDSISMFGVDFKKGEAVEVDAALVAYKQVLVIDKLKGNPEFSEVKTRNRKKAKHDNRSEPENPSS